MTTGAITYRPDGSHIEPDTISGCKKCGIKLTDTRIVAECRGVLQRDWKAAREQADDYPITKRRKLPDTRPSTTRKFNHCGMKGYLTVGFYPDTEQPGEVFICIAKEGTFVSAVLDQLARQVSFLLQRGCPAKLIMDGWRNHIIDPMGPVEGKDSDGSLFDVLAESFLTCCQNYGDCEPDKDHMRRLVP